MAIFTNSLDITLNGTGTEIPTLNVTDPYSDYEISGNVVTTGNYAIVPTGTPQSGTTFIFDYNALVDITTNSNTFSIFGVALTQEQLNLKLQIVCRYNGSAWKVKITGSLDQALIDTINIVAGAIDTTELADGSVTTNKLATNAITTVKILNSNVTTAKIADSAITNAKLANMATLTVKANVTGGSAAPTDVAISTLIPLSGWGLTGNSGTTAGTNFIGTTDAIDLVFKVNNTISGRITNLNSNVSFGKGTLTSNTSGAQNTAIGGGSLSDNTSGDNNVGIGAGALESVITGVGNVGIGTAGQTIITGSFNTIIGDGADVFNSNSLNRIALGANAVADEDYQFALPDNITKFKFQGVSYVLPTADGTAGQVLTTDGAGNLTWA